MNLFNHWRRLFRAAHASNADGDTDNRVPTLRLRELLVAGALAALANAATPLPAAAASAPTVKLSASPESVSSGGSSTLTWSSTNATSCAAAGGWSGTLATDGSKSTGKLTAAQSYTVTCKGAGGSTSEKLTVYLSSEMPKITFTANPTSVASGGSSTLTWSATNAAFCHAYGPSSWDSVEPVKGSGTTNALTATTTFTLACFASNSSGAKTSAKVTIAVASAPSKTTGTATLSWTAPTTNTNGTPVTPLKGYTIYYGTSESSMSQSLVVSGASTDSAEITGLPAGVWYFGIAADAQDGVQSAISNIGSLAI